MLQKLYSKGIFSIFDLTIHKNFAAFGGEYTSEPLIIFYVAHVEFYVAHVEFFKTVHVEFYVTYVENNKYVSDHVGRDHLSKDSNQALEPQNRGFGAFCSLSPCLRMIYENK